MSAPCIRTVYYTASIPYQSNGNEWMPTSPVGPFARLQRGNFPTPTQAHEWADKHIPGRCYGIKRITMHPDGDQVLLIWSGRAR